MSRSAFDSLMASTNSAMAVVTTTAEEEQAGCLIGFHSQSSMSTEHYCLWLSKANHTYRVGLRATHFGVHFLTKDDLPTAERFGTLSGEDTDKFAGIAVDPDDTGVPLLNDCPNHLLLERVAILDDGGDHVCITGRVMRSHSSGPFEPLRLSDVAHFSPGHASEERAIHP